ncbi:hypothetical protein CASFOL_017102 [Castilleja foliolosa]|uniref:Uncharacterized protein n=1 Tax=Castilleja foliolosa TaxID=1961234 RepID=A0ABD3DA37_9LAMI
MHCDIIIFSNYIYLIKRSNTSGHDRHGKCDQQKVSLSSIREFFDSLHSREVYKPTSMKWSVWEQRRDNNELFAVRFLPLLETLNLVPFAKVDEPVSQTLVQEFHTSMRFTGPDSFKYRTNGIEHHVTNDDFIELFGFPIKQEFTVDKHTSYDRKEFWRTIKSDADWNEHEYPATMIYSNATYMAYRFFATVVLNKDVPSRLSGEEVYLLWCMLNDPTAIEIFPHINARIKDAQSTTAQVRPMPLGLGTFVTILAKKYGMGSYANDTFLRPHSLGFGTRKLRRRGGDVTVDIQSEDGTVVNTGRLALTPTPPPPTQQGRTEPDNWGAPHSGSTFHTGEGSNTQAGGHTLEDIWENLEATRTLVQGYRSEVIGYQADLEWYRGELGATTRRWRRTL